MIDAAHNTNKDLCCTERRPPMVSAVFVVSNMAFCFFWGHFKLCHTSLKASHKRLLYQQHTHKDIIAGTHTRHVHIYKSGLFGTVHQTAAIVVGFMFCCTKW